MGVAGFLLELDLTIVRATLDICVECVAVAAPAPAKA